MNIEHNELNKNCSFRHCKIIKSYTFYFLLLPGEKSVHVSGAFDAFLRGYFYTGSEQAPEVTFSIKSGPCSMYFILVFIACYYINSSIQQLLKGCEWAVTELLLSHPV